MIELLQCRQTFWLESLRLSCQFSTQIFGSPCEGWNVLKWLQSVRLPGNRATYASWSLPYPAKSTRSPEAFAKKDEGGLIDCTDWRSGKLGRALHAKMRPPLGQSNDSNPQYWFCRSWTRAQRTHWPGPMGSKILECKRQRALAYYSIRSTRRQ